MHASVVLLGKRPLLDDFGAVETHDSTSSTVRTLSDAARPKVLVSVAISRNGNTTLKNAVQKVRKSTDILTLDNDTRHPVCFIDAFKSRNFITHPVN